MHCYYTRYMPLPHPHVSRCASQCRDHIPLEVLLQVQVPQDTTRDEDASWAPSLVIVVVGCYGNGLRLDSFPFLWPSSCFVHGNCRRPLMFSSFWHRNFGRSDTVTARGLLFQAILVALVFSNVSKNAICWLDTNQWCFFLPYLQDHECRRGDSGDSIISRNRREETSDPITLVPAHHSNVSSACWTIDIACYLSFHAWGILPYFTSDVN